MQNDVGKIRMGAMRALFLLTFIGLAPSAWQEVISPGQPWEPFYGVAVSFWAALAGLSIVGVLYPVKMLPLLLLQLSYKLVWLLGVGFPLWQQGLLVGSAYDLAVANGIGVMLDALVIPWCYIVKMHFVKPVW
ncbi:MAG: hypothetical protein AAF270_10435 [Pseudomonadota bacterium]